jgi:sialic acid synthase SpsE
MKEILLGRKKINTFSKPYVIAEIGVNHGGSLTLAKKMIRLAKKGGADAAKFQSYKAETLASKQSPSYWDIKKEKTRSQFELFKKYDVFSKIDYIKLAKYAKKINIDFISTPFDDEAVEYLNPLVPFFKISSSDITNIPLLKKIANKRKPVVLSTGASSIDEIKNALKILNKKVKSKVVLMHCILNYPTKNKNANLRMIKGLKKSFPNNIIGYSDHTVADKNLTSLHTAFLLGANVLEKHFTHNKLLSGNDHYHSMDFNNLKNFNKMIDQTYSLLGKHENKHPIQSEKLSRRNARRSIVLKKSIHIGAKINKNNIICKRPGIGISPIYWNKVIGSISKKILKEDHILKWSDIKKK